ncbi:hypothetical protein [Streptomyces sp. NPDC003077]|uniref:hypothetical protein n=1 Tax=Streptomyces sp. NPDC003077 TaxID=3154443 RepID=UPI0033B440CA
MGSLRNPIGPLPSSIYWRRRAVALAVVVLLALLVIWAVNLGDDEDTAGSGKGRGGAAPATSITPGPNATESGISQKPGGRDESGSGGGAGSGGDSGSGEGSGSGSGGGGASGGSGAATGSGVGAGSAGDNAPIGAGPGVVTVPAGATPPNCSSNTTELKLRPLKDSYGPDEKPEFEITVKNSADGDCKVDLGRGSALLTISDDTGDTRVWGSADCPVVKGSVLVRVGAGATVTRIVEWNREPSAPGCATPSLTEVPAGDYLAEIRVPGLTATHVRFTLAEA